MRSTVSARTQNGGPDPPDRPVLGTSLTGGPWRQAEAVLGYRLGV
jgi:hypothetical protein